MDVSASQHPPSRGQRRCQTGAMETPLRRAWDNQHYPREHFIAHYGSEVGEWMWNEAPPVFRARNGELYTQQEFSDWYRHPSSAAKPPGAPPAHLASLAIPDTSSPGPVQADGTAQPARMPPPGLGSAVKPAAPPPAPAGHLAPAPPPQPQDMWSQSHFIRVLLPARVALARVARSPSLRTALNIATDRHDLLPLPASELFEGDIRGALNCPHAITVTAEIVNNVPDPNRNGRFRVDFFAYEPDGSITRYHPGPTKLTSAIPSRMSPVTRVFDKSVALARGVGAALHLHPPAVAALENQPTLAELGALRLCDHMDLQDVSPLDAKLVSPHGLYLTLRALPEQPREVDWSLDGFPWWTLMATRDKHFQPLVAEGIVQVLAVTDEPRHVLIVTLDARYKVMATHRGRLHIEKQ